MTQVEIREPAADFPLRANARAAAGSGRVLVVCPSLFVREGMTRLLEQSGGDAVVHAAATMDAGLQLDRLLRPAFVWVHEEADPHFGFVRLFAESRHDSRVAVLLKPGERVRERASLAFETGAFAAFDASSAVDQLLDGLRLAMRGRPHLPSSLRPPDGHGAVARPVRRLLTGREVQVLHLMAEGLQNRQIADLLFISVETVRTHAKATMRKLGAQSRADAVSRGFRLRILSPETFPAPVLFPRPSRADFPIRG
ncbi:response regulator transcription factor [Amycolatopsis saalfeldensis]|uniref:DNA-binding response regulator, NarL/FixJ family, contains REC and HTH domains n=1 Tax=Amycolatopsis saalfeldensis TaxID=394193 RepID=A0A1H8VVK0_9PSEU|nr:response regulator transcription factor [Amycolatopsis saalfeldensis]SEP19421.1 DNA-binding response regulator, NarL/FixJ family, contains REC and HTH domains [Amycolatopsis saalfeldensis]